MDDNVTLWNPRHTHTSIEVKHNAARTMYMLCTVQYIEVPSVVAHRSHLKALCAFLDHHHITDMIIGGY